MTQTLVATVADATPCQTPGAQFHIGVSSAAISVRVEFGRLMDISRADAILLEANLHNAVELALAPLWARSQPIDVVEEHSDTSVTRVHWALTKPHGLLTNEPIEFQARSTHDRSQVTCTYCLAVM